jgi:hypothetical protein
VDREENNLGTNALIDYFNSFFSNDIDLSFTITDKKAERICKFDKY